MPARSSLPALTVRALLCAGCCHAAAAAAPLPEITWYLYDLAPLVIADGPRKGEGFIEQGLHQQLIPALPEYRHKVVVVPIQRVALMLKTDPNACNPGLIKNPERAQFMAFSQPTLAALPSGAFVRRDDIARMAPYLNADGKLVLGKLLGDGQVSVGIDAARSYGGPVDAVLAPYKDRPGVFGLSTPDASRNLVQMVIGKRIDVMLGQPFEVPYYLGRKNVDDIKALHFYRLAEQAESVLNHIACANSEFGQAVIHRVNGVLARPAVRDALAAYYAAWLDDDARKLAVALRRGAFAGGARH
ncbi:MAG: TIGR02285 family protein [Pseudomonadota bacterium]